MTHDWARAKVEKGVHRFNGDNGEWVLRVDAIQLLRKERARVLRIFNTVMKKNWQNLDKWAVLDELRRRLRGRG